MARGPEDLFDVSITLEARISLDKERIEKDPVYRQCLLMTETEAGALQAYLEHYIMRDRFLKDMPSTNGPGQFTFGGRIESNATNESIKGCTRSA